MRSFQGLPGWDAGQHPTLATSREGRHEDAGAGVTALVVEDDARSRLALTVLLRRRKTTVIAATHAHAALDTLKHRPDIGIVLMDIMMPIMDGDETITAIRRHLAHRRLPIIALTAKATAGERERCLAAGASEYITKPIDTNELLTTRLHWLPATVTAQQHTQP